MTDEEVEEEVFSRWPGGWPTQSWVELDNLGDPGAWLQQVFGEPIVNVLRDLDDWEPSMTRGLAEGYEEALENIGFPLPWEVDGEWSEESIEQCRQEIQQEFAAFLRHWRERAGDLL